MNALVAPLNWDIVTDWHHVYRPDELTDKFGGGMLVESVTGPDTFTFTNWLGTHTVTLNVPYCSTCDTPLDAGICSGCRSIHVDVAPLTEVTGDPLNGRVK